MTAYLDYAGIGIVREPARSAMRVAIDEVLATGSVEYARLFAAWRAARESAARLLDCDTDELAMVSNTSAGLQLVADGIDWRPDDEVVVFDRDFPANVQPWRRLGDRGVVLRWVPMRDGGYDLADLASVIRPATRLVAASQVNFYTGFRLDLDAVCRLASEVGALVCVDAVQGLGVLPLSTRHTPVDFLAAGAHKWLCGPPGTGLLYCRRERLDLLRWAPAGWFGYQEASKLLTAETTQFDYDLPLRGSARRFEGGMPNLLGLVGLAAALEELEAVGIEVVADRVHQLTDRIRAVLADLGYHVVSPNGRDAWSGIVGFRHPNRSTSDLIAFLTGRGCHLSSPVGHLRAAPHVWTADSELDAFFNLL